MPKKPSRLAEDWTFVLPQDRAQPPEQQSTFRLAPLTMAERMRVLDDRNRIQRNEDGTIVVHTRANQQLREIVIEHLVDAENCPVGSPAKWPGLEADREQREKWLEQNLEDVDVLVIGLEIREKSFNRGPVKN